MNDTTTITSRILSEGGQKQAHAALIKSSRTMLLWPVCSFLTADVMYKGYDPSEFDAAKRVVVAEAFPELSTLIFHIVVSARDRLPPTVSMCRMHNEPFTFFNLAIYTCHLNVPAGPVGGGMHMPTRVPKLDGEDIPCPDDCVAKYPDGADPISDEMLQQTIRDQNEELVRNYYRFWFKNLPGSENTFGLRPPMISDIPLR